MISRITALLSICLMFALAGCGGERREDRREGWLAASNGRVHDELVAALAAVRRGGG